MKGVGVGGASAVEPLRGEMAPYMYQCSRCRHPQADTP